MRFIKIAVLFTLLLQGVGCNEDSGIQDTGIGQGGSMTRFAIYDNSLYVVSNHALLTYNIGNGTFNKIGEQELSENIETIFARYPYLYIGSNNAMLIYSIEDQTAPEFVFSYSHMRACDPVVVQGNRAYITMRNGNFCNAGNSALEIIDITTPTNPTLIANYPMQSPYGLAVRGNYLFLCEGEYGFKVFDISSETQMQLLKHMTDLPSYDVIARDSWIAVTGDDGVFQFQYPVPEVVIALQSVIPVARQ